jgi:hypothetical protein
MGGAELAFFLKAPLISLGILALVSCATAQHASTRRLTIDDAIELAKAEFARHKQDSPYRIHSVMYSLKQDEWIVFFDQAGPTVMLDSDIAIRISDDTGKACYLFGLSPTCA